MTSRRSKELRALLALCLLWAAGCGDDDATTEPDAAATPDGGPDARIPDAGPDVRDTGLPPGQCRRDSDCPDLGFCSGEPFCSGASPGVLGNCGYPGAPCYDMPLAACEQAVCNEDEDRCEVQAYDGDGDGHYPIGCPQSPADDCAEWDPDRFPGNPEICDPLGRDEDCDPRTVGPDVDGDGEASPICCNSETGSCGRDCDDHDPSVGPRGLESGAGVCDGADNDCDGLTDEDCACEPGRGDCDTVEGCETILATDVTSCGRCGNACDAGEQCIGGVCNPAVGVAVGSQSSCAVRFDGTVHCWGSNRRGQLGDGGFADSREAVQVMGLDGAVAEIAAGGEHVCARMVADGSVRCWGYGGHGQLGDGEVRTSATPVVVTDLRDTTALALGRFHSCALRSDGTVACWGYNALGQIGDGTIARRSTPVSVGGLSGVLAIAAGGYQTCALAAERVLCWGDFQGYGSAVAEPQQLESFGGTWEGLAAGSNHVCARDGAAGQMGCWGRSDYGEVGGWSGGALVHTYIEGIDGIFAGGDLTCATASRGSASDVFCFGSGVPMGLGTFGGSVMGPVMFLRDVTAFAASDGHACALTGGRVRCAGTNDFGQTGDGTFDYHTGFDVDVLGLR